MKNYWSKVKRRLDQLRQLHNLADLLLFLRLFFFAAAVPALMRLKLPRLETLLTPRQMPPAPEQARVQKIINYTDTVLRVGKPLVRSRCLTRGLTLYYFLKRAGLQVSLWFGVASVEGQLAGHCWLVKDGEPFSEPKDPRSLYNVIYTFPSRSLRPPT